MRGFWRYRIVLEWACVLPIIAWSLPLPANAAISIDNTSTTTTDPAVTYDPSFPYWNNVGDLLDNTNFGGGVYLRNSWVLAPFHIGNANGFFFNGTFYATDPSTPSVRIYNDPGVNSSPTDLVLYKVQTQGLPALSPVSLASSTPAVGTSVLMMGFGYARQTPLVYWDSSGNMSTTPPSQPYHEGYQWNSSTNLKRWGTNAISVTGQTVDDGSGTFKSLWTTFTDPNTSLTLMQDPGGAATPYEASAAPGDSGGGVFVKVGSTWVLAGLIHAIDPFPSSADDSASAFYNPTLDGSVSDASSAFAARTYISDLSQYAGQIDTITAPEPGMGLITGLIIAVSMLMRRRCTRMT